MASNSVKAALLAMMIMTVATVHATDPELTSDFKLPAGVTNASMLNGTFFTSNLLRDFAAPDGQFMAMAITLNNFPALDGLGVGVTFLEYNPGTQNPPHTHPRGTEVLFVLEGSLDVGLVDTAGNLFTQTIYERDLFVFPRGLVHFQINTSKKIVRAVASFSSANAGTNVLPRILFGSEICDRVLEDAFKISPSILDVLEAPFK